MIMTKEAYTTVERVSSRPYRRRTTKGEVYRKKSKFRKNVACAICEKYPCFNGIDNMKSNLAETCHQFKKKR